MNVTPGVTRGTGDTTGYAAVYTVGHTNAAPQPRYDMTALVTGASHHPISHQEEDSRFTSSLVAAENLLERAVHVLLGIGSDSSTDLYRHIQLMTQQQLCLKVSFLGVRGGERERREGGESVRETQREGGGGRGRDCAACCSHGGELSWCERAA